jgi:hypothetical protein
MRSKIRPEVFTVASGTCRTLNPNAGANVSAQVKI